MKGFGYKLKKSEQGGGVRTVDFPRYATANKCLADMKKLFFPNGQSRVGSVEDMEFRMADFKCEEIYFSDEFSPESYKKRCSLHTPRLFLLSKDTSESSDDSDYDAELEKSPFEEIAKEPTRDITFQEHECRASSGEENDHPVAGTLEAVSVHDVAHQRVQVVDLTDRATDGLIGTSKERKEIMDQLKEEYEASLEEDKKKELEKEKNVQREALRRSRQNRVLNEPGTKEPRVTVSVRHPILGVIKRAFPRIARSWQCMIGWDLVPPTRNILRFVSALSPFFILNRILRWLHHHYSALSHRISRSPFAEMTMSLVSSALYPKTVLMIL